VRYKHNEVLNTLNRIQQTKKGREV